MNLTENPLKFRLFIGIPLILSLISGYFYFYDQFWTHLDPKTFNYLAEYSGSRFRGHQGRQVLVHREFYAIADQINSYAVKNNLHLIITQSYRPPNKKIYDAIVTPAVKSNHLAGMPLILIWYTGAKFLNQKIFLMISFFKLPDAVKNFIYDIQADPSIRWGGDFETRDPVHLDDSININDIKKWEQHYNQCVADYMNATPKWNIWIRQVLKGLGLE